MPAGYAHYRFGKLLLPHLPADVRQTIQRFRRMYDAGLQVYCFVLSPLISLGAVPHHHLALSVKELTYSSNS